MQYTSAATTKPRRNVETKAQRLFLNFGERCAAGSRFTFALAVVSGASLLFAPRLLAQFPSASLLAPSRVCAQADTEIDRITLHGTDLDELQRWQFSGDQIKATLQPSSDALNDKANSVRSFNLNIPKHVRPGIYESWATSRFGISNSRRFIVQTKPVVDIRASHADPAAPINIRTDCIYEGQFAAQNRHHFEIDLVEGEHFEASVYAHVVDSRGVPVVTCFNPDGQELSKSRAKGYWPAFISLNAKTSGTYRLVISDFMYRGGVEFPFLLEALVGEPAHLESELARLLRPTLPSSTGPPLQQDRLPLADSGGSVLPGGDVARFTTRRQRPPQPQSDAAASENLKAPFRVSGEMLESQWSIDFDATADTDYWIEVQSHALDQTTDIDLILFELSERDGEEIAKRVTQQDDPRGIQGADVRVFARDPHLHWRPAKTGRHRILLVDHIRNQERNIAKEFRLEVREPIPGFSLLAFPVHSGINPVDAKPIGLNLLNNGTLAIQVRAHRHDGFDEAIEIVAKAEDLPQSIACGRTVLAAGQSEGTLVLEHKPSLEKNSEGLEPSAESIPLRIFGHPVGDGKSSDTKSGFQIEASYASIHHAKSPTRTKPQSRLTSALPLYLNHHDEVPIKVVMGDANVIEVEQGQACTIPIQVRRIGSAKIGSLLRAKNLPPKSSCADVTIGAEATEGKATIQIAKDTPPGDYTVWLQCETKLNWSRNPQALQRLEIRVGEFENALIAEKAADADMAKIMQLENSIAAAKEQVAAQRKTSSEKPITVWIPSTSCSIRVVKPAA